MKKGETLALTLGIAAGAVVTALVTSRNEKKNKNYSTLFNGQPGVKVNSDKYDDSEVYYI